MKSHPEDISASKKAEELAEQQKNVVKRIISVIVQKWTAFLQLIGVVHHVFLWVIFPIMSTWLPFYILFYTSFWWAAALYWIWYFYDLDTPSKGSRKWKTYCESVIWKWFADYFPLKLVKTMDITPDKNYILGCHPHGVFSIGAFTALCTDSTGFSKLFPGITPTILTLSGQFYFPFRREFGMWLGGCEVSSKSLKWLLHHPGKGRMIGIVVGGAEEALDSCPGTHNLNLKSRKGFCHYAIANGADIIPSYSFGENDVYDQTLPNPRGSKIRRVQTYIKKKFGFCPPFFSGCGIFTTKNGLLPYRRPITTVIGAPIGVPHDPSAPKDLVEEVHQKYCQALTDLFEQHKKTYGIAEDVHLNIH
uniref:Acyltransferase n=1 Tax=Panagrolaimus sp. JU765 TaxID=591449 RepID=A0AC34QKE2_9BILA